MNLRELQEKLPWTVHYNRKFRASEVAHKDFQHALIHVIKASGKISSVINDAEHGGHDFNHESIAPYVADLVVCALRMANTSPKPFDLESAVIERIEKKNGVIITDPNPTARDIIAKWPKWKRDIAKSMQNEYKKRFKIQNKDN